MLSNQICMLYTLKSCPIVGELAKSPMEGRNDCEFADFLKFGQ